MMNITDNSDTLQNVKPQQAPQPLAVDQTALNEKEREILVKHLNDNHPSLTQHTHDSVEKVQSPGEKMFDTLTYKGIGWLGNAGLSVFLAYIFQHGPGRPVADKVASFFEPKLARIMNLSPEVAKKTSESGVIITGLITGGTLLMLPIKKLEDNKAHLVDKLDHQINDIRSKFGHELTEKDLAIQQDAYERLKAAPKQTWPSILTGRVAGVASVFLVAFGIAKGRDQQIADTVSEKILDTMAHSKSGAAQKLVKSTLFRRVTNLAVMDIAYSLMCEEILYFTTRFYQKLTGKKKISPATVVDEPVSLPASVPASSETDSTQRSISESLAAEQTPTAIVAQPQLQENAFSEALQPSEEWKKKPAPTGHFTDHFTNTLTTEHVRG